MKDKYRDTDPLKENYRDSFVKNPAHFEFLSKHNAALLCIDLQYLDAARGIGVFHPDNELNVPEGANDYYFDTLEQHVLPNVAKLQKTFREHKLEVIHTRIQSLTQDGRDRGKGHRRLKLHAAPGSKEAEFLPEIAPKGDEIIINKTASGVFSSTNVHYVLANLGINALYVCGVYTNECVETTVRDACDLGYLTNVVADACTTVTPELHNASLTTLRDRYARVIDTEDCITDIVKHVPEA